MATKPGLYASIWAKRRRIEQGSGEKMREPGQKGAPTEKAFLESEKTVTQTKEKAMKTVKKKASGGMMDMEGRAMKKKMPDTKGRAMKKAAITGPGSVMAIGMKKGGKAAKKG